MIVIAFDMLDKVVSSELLDKTIKEHFIPYVKENKMNVDKLLSDYCFELMDQTIGKYYIFSFQFNILFSIHFIIVINTNIKIH